MDILVSTLVLLLLLCLVSRGMPQDQMGIVHTYTIDENTTRGHIIDLDLRKTIGLPQTSEIRLGPGSLNTFLSLDEASASLKTIQEFDLEGVGLCRVEPTCCRTTKKSLASSSDDHYTLANLRSLDHLEAGSFCILESFILASSSTSARTNQPQPIGRLLLVIRDVNDNPPIFTKHSQYSVNNPFIVRFNEGPFTSLLSGPPPQVHLPLAYDMDFSDGFRIKRYALLSADEGVHDGEQRNAQPSFGPFRLIHTIDNKEQKLLLEVMIPLDREVKEAYDLVLLAVDGGNLVGRLPVRVIVDDVNEFDPVFVDSDNMGTNLRIITCSEDTKVNTELYQVKATDRDAPPANTIKYYIRGSENLSKFQINIDDGRISLRSPLDYEKIDEYELVVLAVDAGGGNGDVQRTATAIIKVIVSDVNDNRPQINLDHGDILGDNQFIYTFTIYENIPRGSPVTYFSVIDHDAGDNGRVICQLQNWSQVFRLNKFSGLYSIETTADIDRETRSDYTLKVSCQDHGKPPQFTHATIQVNILDVNDAEPVFEKDLYQFRVDENANIGTKLLSISGLHGNFLLAKDSDVNSSLVYRLQPTGDAKLPRIGHQFFEHKTPEGYFITKSPLDRELYPELGFKLCADDSVHVVCTNVLVRITDVNDNPPRFKRDTHVLQIVENQVYTEPLIHFEIDDPDKMVQGDVYHYTIMPDVVVTTTEELEKYFTFRDDKMYLLRTVDRETMATFHFYIVVTDAVHRLNPKTGKLIGSEEMTPGMTEVFINVLDVNDNQPTFLFPNTSSHEGPGGGGNSLNVSCHEIMGSSVGSIRAIDPDLGPNGTVVYSLNTLLPNTNNPRSIISTGEIFYLDNQTGLIYSNTNRLEELCGTHYSFIVLADDIGPLDGRRRTSRQPTTERLIIFLQDQPTLAELQLALDQAQYDTELLDGSANYHQNHRSFSMSTKMILNVILGGSTLFFVGLLVVWIMLLVYHRKRRKRLLYHNQHQQQQHNLVVNGPLAYQQHQKGLTTNMDVYSYDLNTQSVESSTTIGTLPKIYNQLNKMIDSPKMTKGLYTIHGNDAYKSLVIRRPSSELPRKEFPEQQHPLTTTGTVSRTRANSVHRKSSDNILDLTTRRHHHQLKDVNNSAYQRVLLKNKSLGLDESSSYCTFERMLVPSNINENVYKVLDNSNYLLRSPPSSGHPSGKVTSTNLTGNLFYTDEYKEGGSNGKLSFPLKKVCDYFSTTETSGEDFVQRSLKNDETTTGLEDDDNQENHQSQHPVVTSPHPTLPMNVETNFLQDVLNSCV